MSQTKHTPTPWMHTGNISHQHIQKTQLVLQAKSLNSMNIAHIIPCVGMTAEEVEANAIRIVDCVNAMAGIDKPDEYMQGVKLLEKRYYQEQEDKANYRRQRDQLYRMCEELWQHLNALNLDPRNYRDQVAQVLKQNNPSTVVDPHQIHPLQPLNQQS